jgi:predicted short-subunit dehydrogenase-like oxidoreductase (DUF2520 family)
LALVGAGRVGTAVAELLRRRGHRVVAVASRSSGSAARAAQLLQSETFDLEGEVPPCDVVLVGAGDAAIAPVAARLAPKLAPATIVCHFAGSLGVEVLEEVTRSGGRACALHPVQSVPDVDAGLARLPGSAWGVTCSSDVREWAHRLVSLELGGIPVDVAGRARPLWHAASVTTSNGIAALIAAGEAMLESIGVSDSSAVLAPLAAGTVAGARERGGAAALTGPVVRGESDTVARHLEALRTQAPDLTGAYALAAGLVLEVARRAGRIDDIVEQEIGALVAR